MKVRKALGATPKGGKRVRRNAQGGQKHQSAFGATPGGPSSIAPRVFLPGRVFLVGHLRERVSADRSVGYMLIGVRGILLIRVRGILLI